MMFNGVGSRPDYGIMVTQGKEKWIAAAYGPDGLVMERTIEDTEEKALLELSGKLLERLWKIHDIMDVTQGSVPFRSVDSVYEMGKGSKKL